MVHFDFVFFRAPRKKCWNPKTYHCDPLRHPTFFAESHGALKNKMLTKNRHQELKGTINLERGVAKSPPRKRIGDDQDGLKSRMKKWKYPPVEDDLGVNEDHWGASPSRSPPQAPNITQSSSECHPTNTEDPKDCTPPEQEAEEELKSPQRRKEHNTNTEALNNTPPISGGRIKRPPSKQCHPTLSTEDVLHYHFRKNARGVKDWKKRCKTTKR